MSPTKAQHWGYKLATLLFLLAYSTTGQLEAATLTVCPTGCDSVTIQGAVDAAFPDDTIQILTPSPHTEGDILLNKDITIEGQGPATTIVQANTVQLVATTPVFVVDNGSEVTLRSLTLRYGGGNKGGGVNILDGDVVLEDVDVVFNNAVSEGGGVCVASGSTLLATSSKISYNEAQYGGGLRTYGPSELEDTEVSYNVALGYLSPGDGGGISSSDSLVLRSCQVTDNESYGATASASHGGGLYHTGPSLIVSDSLFSSNVAQGDPGGEGGGLYIGGTGSATLGRTTIVLNEATPWGEAGGMSFRAAQLSMLDCTVSGNSAWIGGGLKLKPTEMGFAHLEHTTVYANHANSEGSGGGMTIRGPGATTIVNSTVTGNTADDDGGGILAYSFEAGPVDIASTTITDNTADYDGDGSGNGGGVYFESGTTVGMRNTIVANNQDGSTLPAPIARDCAGTIQSAGYNLIRSLGTVFTSCTIQGDTTGNLHGVDPLLLPLGDNGGPTGTHALDTGSLAIDAGNPAGCTNPQGAILLADQRHGFREDRCDIGAYEESAVTFLIFMGSFETGSFSGWSKIVR